MADIVKIIDSKQAFDDLTRLSTQLSNIESQINSMATTASKMNASLSNINSISALTTATTSYSSAQGNANSKMTELEKITLQLEKAKQKLAISNASEYQELQKVNKELANVNAQAKSSIQTYAQQAKAKATALSSYAKLQAALTKLKKEYQDLAIKQNLGIAINAKEEARLTSLTSKITTLDAALKKTDAGMGVHTRSVGNYGKAFDSLGFSVAQMTRESPAFLISMNTGFMALSNNIPIFVDEVNKAIAANKALAKANAQVGATAQPIVPVWKKLAAALFGWQSLISMGILLLTIFGGRLVEMATGSKEAEKGIRGFKGSLDDLEDSVKTQISDFIILIEKINDINKSEGERLALINKLNKEYPEFNSNILEEKENTKLLNEAVTAHIDLMIRREEAKKLEAKLVEKRLELRAKEQRIGELEEGLSKGEIESLKEKARLLKEEGVGFSVANLKQRAYVGALQDAYDIRTDYEKLQEDFLSNTDKEGELVKGSVEWYQKLISANEDLIRTSKTIKDLDEIRRLQDQNKEYQKQIDLILDIKAKNKLNKASKEEEKYLFGSIGYLDDIIKLYNDLLKKTTDPKNRDFLLEQIKQTEDLKKSLLGLKENKDTIISILPKADGVDLDSFTSDLIDKFKLSKEIVSEELKKFLDNPDMDFSDFEDRLSSVAKAVEDMNERMKESFEQFADTTNMFFDNRIEKLEQDRDANEEYYDNLISLADGNEEEQERLEREKEARDKKLREKQNESARKQAIFNKALAVAGIAMKLGETIIAHKLAAAELNAVSLGTLGTIYQAIEIPLSIALAAAQTAAVISAPVPKFKDGTNNAPRGLAIVGDGGKHEFIEDRFGNIMQTPKTDTLVSFKGGEKVHKDLDSLINSKGYDSGDIYKQTVLASLASERGISTYRLEKVLDNSLKGLKEELKDGIQKGFKNVNFNSYPKVDLGHIKFKNNTL